MRNKNILVIDNEPFIRDIFSQFLCQKGYDIQCAKSNDEALKFLEISKFDLILSDIHMPGMSFNDFLKNIKSSDKHSEIPVIVVSGVPEIISCKDEHLIDGILEKPFTPEILYESVEKVINKVELAQISDTVEVI